MKTCRKGVHQYEGKQCKQCSNLWQQINKERITTIKKVYDSVNRTRFSARQKAKRNERREQYLQSMKDYRSKPENKAKRTSWQIKREKSKIMRVPKWLTTEQLKAIELFYIKASRMSTETNIRFDVDHIVPLQGKNVSGLHVPWNLQILSHSDNMTKGNR